MTEFNSFEGGYMMKRIYEVMKAMDTDPSSFFKQAARGEINLIIESASGDQLKPSLGFWGQVLLDNRDTIPTHVLGGYEGFTNRKLEITQSALNFLKNCDGLPLLRKNVFFFRSTYGYPDVWRLRICDIYTDFTPAQANHAPADQPKPNLTQEKNDDAIAEKSKPTLAMFIRALKEAYPDIQPSKVNTAAQKLGLSIGKSTIEKYLRGEF